MRAGPMLRCPAVHEMYAGILCSHTCNCVKVSKCTVFIAVQLNDVVWCKLTVQL